MFLYSTPPYKFMMMFFLLLSISMGLMSSNWISLWIAMELNLISIMPLLMSNNSPNEAQSLMKYFITQSIGSCLFLLVTISNSFLSMILSGPFLYTILILSIMLKLGMAPLHFWLPPTLNNLSWPLCFIILTLQKIIPLIILSEISYNTPPTFIISVIFFSVIISVLIGNSQTQMKLIITYSSINHMAWMFMLIFVSTQMMILYYLVYTVINLSLIINLNMINTLLLKIMPMNNNISMLIPLTLLSLGGLPPLLGFWPKLMTLGLLIEMNLFLPSLLLIIGSIGTLLFYANISFTLMMNYKSNFKQQNYKFKFWSFFLSFLATSPMTMLLFI